MTADQRPVVDIERNDGVLQLRIDAPATRNSLSTPGVVEGLLAGLDQLENDPELRCAILTGAGGAFCSGGDLRQLASAPEADTRRKMSANAWLYRRIALADKLVIAAVDGPAFGAGLGLATCCDLVVAGASARFCCAFVRVGAMPDAGLFWSLPARVGVPMARRMMLFAEELDGAQARAAGLADEHVTEGSALPAAHALARRLVEGPGRAHGRIKAGLRQSPMSIEQALAFQLDNAPGLFASADFQEGAAAFFEKRKPVFTGR
ncbi:enoyl-CoA hydratase/isomerase family protein [Variovorax sp. Sphag1AA]|uniref:enoyl-CoA hydratase/isomerase family protein n=1 Tax=Variovorax sp. Sphag1AA TaxID=2587027 RepID=UPI0016102F5A|nr:enoyl-CoA hydratase/isomerase family protein [Variovorax sp. Sphag1AA]MBB3181422.1 enoyl-CoA hydratase/carnithine racemase [Variovorax sp. Sphag1AA]